MFKKTLCQLHKHLICTSPPHFKSVHTNSVNVFKPFVNFPSTEIALPPDWYVPILQACCDHALVRQGKQVHAQLVVNGAGLSTKNNLLGTKLLAMYVLCGSFLHAKNVLRYLELGLASPWNWMIRGFTMMGLFNYALRFYFKMLGCGTSPDKYTFPPVIKACGGLNNVSLAKYVHERVRLMGLEVDVFVGSSLIKLYAENGCIYEARELFDKMPQRDSVLWNVMINGYVRNGDRKNCVEIFLKMRESDMKPNSVTYACVLSVCASEELIWFGTQLHGLVFSSGLELDSPVANTLMAMYSKCQRLSDASKLFNLLPQTDLVSWNGMISGYVQNGFMIEASNCFRNMISARIEPDSITFASFLPSVTEFASLKQGKEIHCYIIRHGVPIDVFLKGALIDLYFKCRNVEMACKILDQSNAVDVIVFTSMISGFVLNGMNSNALEIFRRLLQVKMRPNSVTLASIFPAFAGMAALKLGGELHGNTIKNGLDKWFYVGSAITDMYAKCGRLDLARQVFQKISAKDAVCWNSMITSCSQNGKPEEAIDLFRQMGLEGAKYDCVSISAALSSCANLPALHYGKEIHGFMIRRAFSSDIFSGSALIDMYAKCGNLDVARQVFNHMEGKNEVSWNSIIAAYGNHGHLEESLTLFHEMLQKGILPDHVTFLGIISACGHVGRVDDGIHFFRLMTESYQIPARMEHYACMVDLFGRAGRLTEAFKTIKNMPFSPDAGVWGTLLGACRVHGNVELAEEASKHLLELDPHNSGYYILLSNIHADAGDWRSVLKIRSLMKERGVQKVPGYSWIDINNITHMFVAADGSHPDSAEIYSLLNNLLQELRREGYVPQLYLPMHPQILGI
ncbi:pentatricopeptide repeat-containing protein At4g21300 [Humulus lupulus]|uniref:pentatricopeptide repeat-containing protein At4g21300 n=1 Tax=Humulus lupulus TaxID=3486 RepID=UPI002B412702|nr:pentatricopeptide repeat-containing protein At4g21300 [Humulus lupulus]